MYKLSNGTPWPNLITHKIWFINNTWQQFCLFSILENLDFLIYQTRKVHHAFYDLCTSFWSWRLQETDNFKFFMIKESNCIRYLPIRIFQDSWTLYILGRNHAVWKWKLKNSVNIILLKKWYPKIPDISPPEYKPPSYYYKVPSEYKLPRI